MGVYDGEAAVLCPDTAPDTLKRGRDADLESATADRGERDRRQDLRGVRRGPGAAEAGHDGLIAKLVNAGS